MGKKKRRMRTSTRKAILGLVAFALLALVLGVVFGVLPLVCQSKGERRLVGTWEVDQTPAQTESSGPTKDGLPPPASPQDGKAPADPREAQVQRLLKGWQKALGQWAALASPDMRVTFDRDGTYTESMGFGGRRQVVTGHWEAVEGGDDRVVVRVYGADGDRSRAQELTITFEGDDVMLYPSAAGAPIRMRRRND